MDWYFENGGSESGPYATAEINHRIKSGEITADTLLWQEGMPEWQRAGDVSEFADWFIRPPPIDRPEDLEPALIGEPVPPKSGEVGVRRRSQPGRSAARQQRDDNPVSRGRNSRSSGRPTEQRRSKKPPRAFPWIRIIGLLAVICLFVGGAFVGYNLLMNGESADETALPANSEPESVLVVALLSSRFGDSISLIREEKPAEFNEVVAQLDSTNGADRSPEGMSGLAKNVADFFYKRYAPFVTRASDSVLKAAIETHMANLEAVQKIYPDQCARFIVGGVGSLEPDRSEVLAPLFIAERTALMSAFFDGSKVSETRSPPTEDDLDIVLNDWQAAGADVSDIESLERQSESDPNLCQATVSVLQFILAAEGEGAERVRASFVAQIASKER